MGKEKIVSEDSIIDRVMYSHDTNITKSRKPLSEKIIMLLFFALIIVLILLVQKADSFSLNQTTILGIFGSTCISVFILFFTLNHEKRDDYREAKRSAKILAQLLDSTYSQISRIEKGMLFTITYPANWLDYYKSCCVYLKYDYLEYLLKEFEIIDKINTSIIDNNSEQLSQMLKYRNMSITDWTFDFSILSVQLNLALFSIGHDERMPWKLGGTYVEFQKFFIENYSAKTKELTVEFLKNNENKCNANVAEYYVMEKIRDEAALKTGKYKFEALENKKVLSAIFRVYLSLKNDDPFSLCWGELTLKDNK